MADGDEDRQFTFALPSPHVQSLPETEVVELESILGCKLSHAAAPAIVNVGAIWVVLTLNNAVVVLDLQPDFAKLTAVERRLGITGLTVFGRYPQGDVAIKVRTFAPSCGVEENPVCGSGSGNASVAAFQWAHGLLPAGGTSYVAAQGHRVGRDGRVQVQVDSDGQVRVGGSCITCGDGRLVL